MMQSKLIPIVLCLSVATTVWVSLVNCAAEDGIPEYYLPVPSYSKSTRDETYQFLMKDTRPAGLEPQKMLEEFDHQIETSSRDWEREFYKQMSKLADPNDKDCTWSLRNYIFEIMTLAKEHPDVPVFANYMNYVKTYGKAKFTGCLENIRIKFVLIEPPASLEIGFDSLVGAYSGLKGYLMPEDLYKKARGLCLSRDELKLEKTLEVAKGYRHDKDASPLEIVQVFVGKLCKYFEEGRIYDVMQVVNLGEALGAEISSDLPVEYLKLIEYDRICVAWNKRDKTRPGMVESVDGAPPADSPLTCKKWYKFLCMD